MAKIIETKTKGVYQIRTWFGTKVKVTNVNNGKTVVVTVNDRGSFKKTPDFKYYYRVLDLAKGAFLKIASAGAGVIKIKYEILE